MIITLSICQGTYSQASTLRDSDSVTELRKLPFYQANQVTRVQVVHKPTEKQWFIPSAPVVWPLGVVLSIDPAEHRCNVFPHCSLCVMKFCKMGCVMRHLGR